ncbi:MAG: glycerol-3-phosphate dehydrogenase/oxidase [Planctomycetes bacterium]|nr:glycerol-3-phosphate dehydrogenase/oxidase [Planctomycetota bacterium]
MKRNVEALTDGTFDLLVVGGGITGAGVALDASLRGLRVALIDKGDFASGTSSVSSKLVHGGLRYLEHAGFHLVHEALHERGRLLHNACHLVQPLRFILPFYDGARLSPWKWRLGLTLYDFLAGTSNIHRHRPLRRREIRREFPTLVRHGLQGGAEFFDAQMDDARLCIEVMRTAAECGATPANYVEATAFTSRNGRITGVRARDHVGDREIVIAARQFLNAAGPWVDRVCQLAGDDSGPRLQPTRGVHILTADRGLRAAFLLLHPSDGRVLFIIPWMGKTLIGTTDTFADTGPDDLHVTDGEIAYLLEAHNHYFQPGLQPSDVMGSFIGLRPLIRSERGGPSSLSREFRVFTSPSGLVSVAGGKYTTFRQMAEDITDVLVARLDGPRRRCSTRRFPLSGVPSEPWLEYSASASAELEQRFKLPRATAQHLVNRYGRHALELAHYLDQSPEARQPVCAGEPELRGEFAYQRDHEMAVYPADHLLRRTRLGMYHPDLLRGKIRESS